MGSPYLNSGETIVLTTSRVYADAIAYDAMLTTERIFLIDNQNERFEPQIIPLSAILSVQGGKTPAHDPVIILLFRTTEEGTARQPLNLVFSQDPNENRKIERDGWMRTLIQLSIARQERDTEAEIPAVPEGTGDTGLRPVVRHGVAPEKVRPLSNVAGRQVAPAPVTVIPDEVGDSMEMPVHTAVITPVTEEHPAPVPAPEGPVVDPTPVRETSPFIAASPARVIIPQIIEELLPERTRTAPPVEQLPEPETASDQEKLQRSIESTIQSLAGGGEPPPEPPQVPETDTMPGAVPGVETPPEQPVVVPPPAADQQVDLPENIRALHTGSDEADTTVPQEKPGTIPETEPEIPPADIHGISGSPATISMPENVVQESVSTSGPDEVLRREPKAAEAPPVRHPIPPAREIRPYRSVLVYSALLLLVIALVATGAMLLFPPGPEQTGITVTPTTRIVQAATLPSETVQPSEVPPASTRITPASPSPSMPVSVPQTGVWVEINSTSNYAGRIGNAGSLQPVSGSGDNFYKVLRIDRIVQVSVQKQDNSGALLAVGIFRNGTLLSSSSVTSPMGTVDMLIDPTTARPPGLPPEDTIVLMTTPVQLEDY